MKTTMAVTFWILVILLTALGALWVREYILFAYWQDSGMKAFADGDFSSEFRFFGSLAITSLWSILWGGCVILYAVKIGKSIKMMHENEPDQEPLLSRFLIGLICLIVGLHATYMIVELEGSSYLG